MRSTPVRILLLFLMLFATASVVQANEPALNVAISTAPGAQYRPRTDGTTVVWNDARSGDPRNGDVYATNLANRQEIAIATGIAHQGNADIADGIIVWQETAGACPPACDRNIRGIDLATGQRFDVAVTTADESHPAISNHGVVWIEGDPATQTFRIKLRDLRSMSEPTVIAEIPQGIGIEQPVIDGNVNGWKIVWVEQVGSGRNIGWRMRLHIHAFASPSTTVTVVENAGLDYGYDLRGDTIIHARPDGLFMYDLSAGYPSSTALLRRAPYLRQPTLDTLAFFWSEEDGEQRSDLLGSSRGADAFDVAVTLGNNTDAFARNGVLVWTHDEGDGGDIYAIQVRDALPSGRRAPPMNTSADLRYFAETGHNLAFGFKTFWEASGGVPVFGYPLTEEFDEFNGDLQTSFTTQYFERQRLEFHHENVGTPYEVLLGRLGTQLLEAQGRYWELLPKADPATPHYFPATGQAIAPEFWDYWRMHGLEFGDADVSEREALALFGYPITPAMPERNPDGDLVLTQWFERARFEYHPDNPAEFRVLLGRLGAEALTQRGWLQ